MKDLIKYTLAGFISILIYIYISDTMHTDTDKPTEVEPQICWNVVKPDGSVCQICCIGTNCVEQC